ncbi:MAG TPA: type II secretion system F family protein [Candidatus Angelobacter sp.]|jgi:tight adherence protein C|nr:type II secretion system F family protein [Candidatus Angelobacter sp.]
MIYALSFVIFVSVLVLARTLLLAGTRKWEQDRGLVLEIWNQMSAEPPLVRFFSAACKYIGRWNTHPALDRYRERLSRDILTAGDPWHQTPNEIIAMAELSFVVVMLLAWLFLSSLFGSFQFFLGIVFGGLAALTPGYLLGQKAVARKIMVNRQLPFALDLLILSMEAGSSFLESIETLVTSNPTSPLAEEFNHVLQAIQHGKTRRAALLEMADRVKSEDLAPVIHGINTGEELGTPIGSVLRVQADGIRLKRTQRAEKLAAEASSKILFPTLLIMVAVLLMLMGPVIIKGFRDGWF